MGNLVDHVNGKSLDELREIYDIRNVINARKMLIQEGINDHEDACRSLGGAFDTTELDVMKVVKDSLLSEIQTHMRSY